MKIGLDLRFWRSGTGGIGRYSRNLLAELLKIDQTNHYTAIITTEDEPEFGVRAPNLKKLVVNIPHFSVAEQTKLAGILNQHQFDLVHFTNFNHPILYRRPFVVTIHDIILHLFPGEFQQKSKLRRLAFKAVFNDCKRAKKIIVPSQSSQRDLVQKLNFKPAKLVVTPEGSEKLFRLHTDREKIAVKERLKLPKKYLLFVSRWEKYKGLPALIEAYEQLIEKYPDLGLVICGRPDPHNPDIALKVQAAQKYNKNVVTPGFVSDEDLAAIYSAAAVYVHPSWYEGFGIMILEAFAAGVPVVTSNNSSLPEVVGGAGIMVDPHHVSALASAIDQVLADPNLAADLVTKGLTRKDQFSWASMAKQTLSIYQQILDG